LAISEEQDAAWQVATVFGFNTRFSGGQSCDDATGMRQLGCGGEFTPRGGSSIQSDGTGRVDRFGGASVATTMLSLSPATRVFLALTPIDGRKGFNGLTTLVKETLGQEPTSGFLFVFVNKARNRLKILFWDGSGLILCTKRLERGTFALMAGEGKSLSLRPEELTLLMHGI